MSLIDQNIELTHSITAKAQNELSLTVSRSYGSITSFLGNIGNSIAHFVYGVSQKVKKALNRLKDWIIGVISDLVEEIRVWKWKFRRAIAKWLDNPLAFWLTLAGIVVLAIYLPAIIAWVKSTKAWEFAKKVFDDIKKFTGKFLDKIHYIQLLTVHKISLILNPNYQDFWRDLDEAFMALAEEIEMGTGVLNNLTYAVRELYFSTYTMLGLDMDSIEIQFYNDATSFWANANKRWERYVRNPQLIFEDIMKEMVYPVLAEQAQYGQERAQHDLENAEKVIELFDHLNTFRVALDNVISALPDDIEETVRKQLGPVYEQINYIFDEKLIPLENRVTESIAVIENTIEEVNDAIYKNMLRKRTEGDNIISILFDGTLNISEKRKLISAIFDKILSPEMSRQDEMSDVLIMTNTVSADDVIPESKPAEPEKYVPMIRIDISKIKESAEGWFVGEF